MVIRLIILIYIDKSHQVNFTYFFSEVRNSTNIFFLRRFLLNLTYSNWLLIPSLCYTNKMTWHSTLHSRLYISMNFPRFLKNNRHNSYIVQDQQILPKTLIDRAKPFSHKKRVINHQSIKRPIFFFIVVVIGSHLSIQCTIYQWGHTYLYAKYTPIQLKCNTHIHCVRCELLL